MSDRPVLFGLVLAGGSSLRMGQDKGCLDYRRVPQVQWAARSLARCCRSVFVSVRSAANLPADYDGLPLIEDRAGRAGPLAGLAAAYAMHPDTAWLLLAIDMPLVDRATLDALITARDPEVLATVFRHPDGTLEPLCAIWEPAAGQVLERSGEDSLRRLLASHPHREIEPPHPRRIVSVNTPADARRARQWLDRERHGRLGRSPQL